MPSVVSQIDAMDAAKTVYPGELVTYMPTPNETVAVRLISIDLERGVCELEVTATKNLDYPRKARLTKAPFANVVKRTRWDHPRFSLRWLDYPTAKERAGEQWQRLSKLVAGQ